MSFARQSILAPHQDTCTGSTYGADELRSITVHVPEVGYIVLSLISVYISIERGSRCKLNFSIDFTLNMDADLTQFPYTTNTKRECSRKLNFRL